MYVNVSLCYWNLIEPDWCAKRRDVHLLGRKSIYEDLQAKTASPALV